MIGIPNIMILHTGSKVWLQGSFIVISNLIIEVSSAFSVVEMATAIEGEIAGGSQFCRRTISKTIKEVKPKQLS